MKKLILLLSYIIFSLQVSAQFTKQPYRVPLMSDSASVYANGVQNKSAIGNWPFLTQSGIRTYATATGTNTYTATISPAISSYSTGQQFVILFNNANSGASTINLNSLGAKSIKKNVSVALDSGDIKAGQAVPLVYDGTNFQIVGGGLGSVGSSTDTSLLVHKENNLADLESASTARTNLGVPAGSGTSTGTNTGDQTTTSANADIAVGTGTTNPVLTLNSGTGSNQIVKRNSGGDVTFLTQSAPSTPASGFNIYADASNRFGWRGANGYNRIFDGVSNSATRIYTLPNQPGQVAINTGTIGNRLDDYFDRASIGSAYTQLGSTATFGINSNLLTISGGASTYNEALYLNQSSNSEESTFSIEINQNVSAGKLGVGVVNVAGNDGFLVDIDLTAGGTRGQLTIKSRTSSSTTVRSTSTANLSFLDTDTIVLKIVLSKFTLTGYAYKKSAPTTKVICPSIDAGSLYSTWTVARIWNPCIYAYSGSQKVSNFKWEGNETKGALIAIQGDSEFKGYGATNPTDRASSLWEDNLRGYNNIVNFSSGGNRVVNLTSCINDLDVALPKYVFVNIGINNARDAQVLASFQADFTAYLTLLEARGIIPILSTIVPAGTSYASSSAINTLVVSYNTWISSLSTKYKVIDLYTAMSSAGVLNTLYDSGDFLHWNSLGNQIAWQTILAGTGDLFKYSNNIANLYNRFNVSLLLDQLFHTYSKNGSVWLGVNNTNSGTSSASILYTGSDVANGRLATYASTTVAPGYANRSVLYNSHAGLGIMAANGSGDIKFLAGGGDFTTNLVGTFGSTGAVFNAGLQLATTGAANFTSTSTLSSATPTCRATNDGGVITYVGTGGSSTSSFFSLANVGLVNSTATTLGLGTQAASSKVYFFAGGTTTSDVKGGYTSGGLWKIGDNGVPTALLHLKAGTATTSTAPLKFTSGTNLTTGEAGTVEYDGSHFFATPSGTSRFQIATILTGSATLDFGSTSAQSSADLTITVTGAADGDAVSVGPVNASTLTNSSFTAWVSATNTVTVRFNNYSSGGQDPASGTFKVFVNKN